MPPTNQPVLSFAQCRSLGHEWRYKGPVTDESTHRPFAAQHGMVGVQSQCSQCKTWRTKWITRSGEVFNRYEYPDGYSRHGEERLTSQQWRSNWVVTLFDELPRVGARA